MKKKFRAAAIVVNMTMIAAAVCTMVHTIDGIAVAEHLLRAAIGAPTYIGVKELLLAMAVDLFVAGPLLLAAVLFSTFAVIDAWHRAVKAEDERSAERRERKQRLAELRKRSGVA